jgi:hypothetical protein
MSSLPSWHSYCAAAFSKMPLSTKWTERQTHFLIVLLSRLGVPCPRSQAGPPACLRVCSPPSPLFGGGGGDHARWRGGGGLDVKFWFVCLGSRILDPEPVYLRTYWQFVAKRTNISLKMCYCPLLLPLVPGSEIRDP